MANIKVYNMKGEEVGDLELNSTVFEAKINVPLMHQAVVLNQASERRGTHESKTRGQVSGSTKKPWRQKGTGRARVGTKRNPVWTGGGVAFGPHMREYGFKMPKKMRRAALRSALSEKFAQGEIVVFDEFAMDAPKTKVMADLFKKFEAENDATGVTIYFFKNQIVMRTKVDNIDTKISPYTYKDFVQNYAGNDVKSFSKTQLIEYMRSSKMNNFYGKYMISSFISLLLVEIMITLIDALEIAAFGWLTTMITRIRIRFVAIYNMAVYALTLPMILNMLYIIVNYFTTFTISYFQVAYITIAYIYLAAVIFLLKDDLLKKLEEVEKIKKEQEKVREEIKEQEDNKEPESKEEKEPKNEDKTDDENKDAPNDQEPDGSEA